MWWYSMSKVQDGIVWLVHSEFDGANITMIKKVMLYVQATFDIVGSYK